MISVFETFEGVGMWDVRVFAHGATFLWLEWSHGQVGSRWSGGACLGGSWPVEWVWTAKSLTLVARSPASGQNVGASKRGEKCFLWKLVEVVDGEPGDLGSLVSVRSRFAADDRGVVYESDEGD